MRPELRARLTVGPLMALFFLACLGIDLATGRHLGILSLVCVAILLSGLELRSLSLHVGALIPIGPLLVGSQLLLFTYYATYDRSAGTSLLPESWHALPLPGLIIAGAFIWMCLVQMARNGAKDFTRFVGMGMLCLGYLGVCGSMFIPLANLPALAGVEAGDGPLSGIAAASRGTQLVILHAAVCKVGDVFAFFGGRLFGRHKLAPTISPGKTVEGFLAAIIGAVVAAYGFTALLAGLGLPPAFRSAWHPLVWGLVLGPLGVLGDLVESCLKRDAGIKDSSQIVPGFGGFLDIFDAVILSAPVAYLLGLLLR